MSKKKLIKIFYIALILIFFELFIKVTYNIRNYFVDYIPLPYTLGFNYGPTPPWSDELKILIDDDYLYWKAKPNIKRKYIDIFKPVYSQDELISIYHKFLPMKLPEYLRNNKTWSISLNSDGFRDDDFPEEKYEDSFRIICLGDSWTFGSNVGQDDTYPHKLSSLLSKEYPNRNFEVFNLGVLGYSSHNGLRLMKKVTELKPDVLISGFAMNEQSGSELIKNKENTSSLVNNINKFIDKIELLKLLKYFALFIKWEPKTPKEYYTWLINIQEWYKDVNTENKDNKLRTSLKEYDNNMNEIIDIADDLGSKVILYYPEFSIENPYLKTLKKISNNRNIPLVDSSIIISNSVSDIEKKIEKELNLKNEPIKSSTENINNIKVVFRVFTGNYSVPEAIYISGNHKKLGQMIPNKIMMYDDGTHGDQVPYDKVWSYSEEFEMGTEIYYFYTNSGKYGEWNRLDVIDIRNIKVEPKNEDNVLYNQIDSFGRIYMKADQWHTDSMGYELIATEMLKKLEELENFKVFVTPSKLN